MGEEGRAGGGEKGRREGRRGGEGEGRRDWVLTHDANSDIGGSFSLLRSPGPKLITDAN